MVRRSTVVALTALIVVSLLLNGCDSDGDAAGGAEVTAWCQHNGNWGFDVVGEDFSSATWRAHYQYDAYGRMYHEYGTVTTVTDRTYNYDAVFDFNQFGEVIHMIVTVSGGLVGPTPQTVEAW